jgi:hypothetical protein
MMEILEIFLPVIGLAMLAFFLLRSGNRGGVSSRPARFESQAASFRPIHYLHFPQICQALSMADHRYLQERAGNAVAKTALRERRDVAIQFLGGLHEDFTKLERLARVVASLSPSISRAQEAERLVLSLRFRFVYACLWARLRTGSLPLVQLEHLSDLVGRLAYRMERAMDSITALSEERFGTIARG